MWLDFLKFPVLGCHGVTFIARMWSLLWAAVAAWTVCDAWADDVFRVVRPLATFGDLAHGVAQGNFMSSPPFRVTWPQKDWSENLPGGEQVRNYQIKIPQLLDEEQKSVE